MDDLMISDFPILRMRYADDNRPYLSHTHPACELIYIKRGAIDLTVGEKRYRADGGTLIFIGAMEEHVISIAETPYERTFCLIAPQTLEQPDIDPMLTTIFKNRPFHFSHCVKPDQPERVEALLETIYAEYQKRDVFSEQMTVDLIEQLLILIYRKAPGNFFLPGSGAAANIWAVQRSIELRYAEPITVSQLAAEQFISPDYLTRTFRELTGYTPKQYLLENRLLHSRQMLLTSELSVSDISFRCGFPDVGNFIRSFKERYHVTPKQFQIQSEVSHPYPYDT